MMNEKCRPLQNFKNYFIEGVIGDGNCLIHCLCKALNEEYQNSYNNNASTLKSQQVWRSKFSKRVRTAFANHIKENVNVRTIIRKKFPGLFESVYDGYPANCDKGPYEYLAIDKDLSSEDQNKEKSKLDKMVFNNIVNELQTSRPLLFWNAYIITEILSWNKPYSIKVLIINGDYDNNAKDFLVHPMNLLNKRKDVHYLIIYSRNNHYENIVTPNGIIFSRKDPLVKFLLSKIHNLK